MKTKTLLIAAAALAVGIISSQAQSVYSQNVVGYCNIVTPTPGINYMISVPFKIGVSNGANEIFPNVPEFSQVLIWNPALGKYASYQTDTTSATGWSDANTSVQVSPPILPVGMGFFFSPGDVNVTNTFAGSVAINTGTSNVTTYATPGINYMVGCVVPYAGSVTNGNDSGGGPNMNALPEFTQLLFWNPALGKYASFQTDTTSATGWSDANTSVQVPVPSITVGQGFFLSPGDVNAKWTVGLSAQ